MPYDGNGNYAPPSPPTFPAVDGEVIRSDYHNAIINDIATALSTIGSLPSQADAEAGTDNAKRMTALRVKQEIYKLGTPGYNDLINANFFSGYAGVISTDRVSGALTGQANFGSGPNALLNVTSGGNNTALGRSALAELLTTGGNTAVGESALQYGAALTDCTALGHNAGQNLTSGVGAVVIGKNAMRNATTADGSISIGDSSSRDTTTGTNFLALGYGAMAFNITGTRLIAIGHGALYTGTANNRSIGIGMESLEFNFGDDTIAIGDKAGRAATGADGSVFIGSQAGTSGSQKVDAQNSIAIGFNAFTTADNQTVIGNSGQTEFFTYGSPWFDHAVAAQAMSRVRNVSSDAAAYAGMGVNAFGNSWGWRMGSLAANSNAFQLVIDAFGSPVVVLQFLTSGISDYADDTAAAAGGVPVKGIYRTGSALKIRVT